MTLRFNKLSQQEIMNEELVKKIQESINVQYPHYSAKQKALKFANIVHEKIDQSLPDYSKETKRKVRHSLVQQKLTANSFTIHSQDVVDTSMALVDSRELKTKLPEWLHTKVDIEIGSLEEYVNTLIEQQVALSQNEVATTTEVHQSDIDHSDWFILDRDLLPSKHQFNTEKKTQRIRINKQYITGAIIAFLIMIPLIQGVEKAFSTSNDSSVHVKEAPEAKAIRVSNSLPRYLQYEPINEKQLRNWLNDRNSMLADEPYFSTIIDVANEHNLHPFLLFAVTGQEQGFVPRSNKNATKIANNPFNVFHSWEDFNTNILESSQIAARTIVHLSEGRPESADPIQWINRKYAEDPNWWKGVAAIFEKMGNEVQ